MSDTQSAAELAAVERAAIAAELAARNIPDEKKEPTFEPTAEQLAARAGRKAIGPVELKSTDYTAEAPKRNSHYFAERDYARLELAELAAEAKRMEREAKRADAAMKRRAAKYSGALAVLRTELPEQLASLAAANKGGSEALAAVAQVAEAAAALGISEADAAQLISAARDYTEAAEDVRAVGSELAAPLTKADREAAAEAKAAAREAAAARPTFADMAGSEAAKAAREAAAAIGPRAAGLVVTKYGANTVTVCRSVAVPGLEFAARRAEELAAELTAAEAKLAAAEAKAKAAAATKAKRPTLAAEADANRIAAAVGRLAPRAALAAQLADVAEQLAGMNMVWSGLELAAFIGVPVAVLPLAEAAEAAAVPLRIRADVMPAQYRENGPSAKAARPVSDPTGNEAAALADGAAAERAKQESNAADLAARTAGQSAAAGAIREMEERREAYKARRAEAARIRRAAAKMGNKIQARNAKRAAR